MVAGGFNKEVHVRGPGHQVPGPLSSRRGAAHGAVAESGKAADCYSVGRGDPARGFKSLPLRFLEGGIHGDKRPRKPCRGNTRGFDSSTFRGDREMLSGVNIPGGCRRDRSWRWWVSSHSSWAGEVAAIRSVSKTENAGSSPARPVAAKEYDVYPWVRKRKPGVNWFGGASQTVRHRTFNPRIRGFDSPASHLGPLAKLVMHRTLNPGTFRVRLSDGPLTTRTMNALLGKAGGFENGVRKRDSGDQGNHQRVQVFLRP